MDFDWHVFISHASEDKADVARPLADSFLRAGLKVWLDEAEIKVGDSIREKIDVGLLNSAYGVVVMSPHFLSKTWTRAEVDGLFSLETLARKRILPVWHKVEYDDVVTFSPIIAGRLAANTSQGLASVSQSLIEAMDEEVTSIKDDGWPIHSGRITKRVLMEIPEGYILMSNSCTPDLQPLFLEGLGSINEREGV